MKADTEKLAQDRAEVARDLLAVVDAAALPILADPAVWIEEASREDTRAIAWPLQGPETSEAQLLRYFATETVRIVLQTIEEAHGLQWVPQEDPADKDFQLVLRVVRRAIDQTSIAMRARFGGAGRMSIKRELMNIMKERTAAEAFKAGKLDVQAAAEGGMSRSATYRALHRPRR